MPTRNVIIGGGTVASFMLSLFSLLFLAEESADPTANADFAPTFLEDAPVKQVIIHRTTIHTDVIDIFSNPDILNFLLNVTVIDTNDQEKKGKGRGVTVGCSHTFLARSVYSIHVRWHRENPFH